MSDTERNKQLAIELLKASAVHDGKRFDELLHPDATYWVIGKPHLFSYGGEQTREQIVAYMSTPSIFVGGVQTTFGDITAEDDRVAVEAQTKGTLPDGRVYTNVYHYLMKFRDGKIIRVKEYLDTQSAAEFFSKK
jgi:ketosteroid isomerase-like protein